MLAAIIQPDLAWQDPQANRGHLAKMAGLAPSGTNLLVLPEMFSTGFVTEPEGVAEADCGSLEWMKALSAEKNCAVAGSISTLENGRYYNRFYFVTPDGKEVHYDKHHLFTYSGEHMRYTAGKAPVIAEWMGFRILLQVCYDLRFPIFSRNNAQNPYDLALYVASWPEKRSFAWSSLLRARAIENECYVIGVNRVGVEPSGLRYSGDSVILDFDGKELAACPSSRENVISTILSKKDLEEKRAIFPVLSDRD